MSAIFIIKYSGQPLRVADLTLVPTIQATQFTSEADAWYAAAHANLNPTLCQVVTLDKALEEEAAR